MRNKGKRRDCEKESLETRTLLKHVGLNKFSEGPRRVWMKILLSSLLLGESREQFFARGNSKTWVMKANLLET